MDYKAIPPIYENSKFWPRTRGHEIRDNSGSVSLEVFHIKAVKAEWDGEGSNLNWNCFKDSIISHSIRK